MFAKKKTRRTEELLWAMKSNDKRLKSARKKMLFFPNKLPINN